MESRVEIKVVGIVQGVGFRPFIYRTAVRNRLAGYVRNRGDAGVEIVLEGDRQSIEKFLSEIRSRKPPLCQIYDLRVAYKPPTGEFIEFKILESQKGGELSGSTVPADVSICKECVSELRSRKDRRYDYFFITCTDCGPRFTTIEGLPYDRTSTTMKDFPVCSECLKEYSDPTNRRFHAQTIACWKCGPRVYLAGKDGAEIESHDPVRKAGELIEEGHVVGIRGNGGFHLATSTIKSEPVLRLRNTKHRSQKPFAVMARGIEEARSFSVIGEYEAALLLSAERPIVLLAKSGDYYLSDAISPRLHNVGVMLPYTGMHEMLFDNIREPAFVMTSGNAPSEPIITKNEDAVKRLSSVVDYFLLHNREISQPCDDSVVRLVGGNREAIRRSRGYAPRAIRLSKAARKSVLALGAEENVTSCVLQGDKAFLTQHIGDVERLETLAFLRRAIDHILRLTNAEVDAVSCDMHPKFNTTHLAKEMADAFGRPVFPIQHHHAHIASLMGEYGISEMVGISCDGLGYGSDGMMWGGEVLRCDATGFQRLGHLEEQPMVGGDLATRYPIRMAAGILRGSPDIEQWLFSNSKHFPYGRREVEIVLRQLKSGKTSKSTSCGRVLDAVSALIGVCYERTYEGEPAMKLESAAVGGSDVLAVEPQFNGTSIATTSLLEEIFEARHKYNISDLAFSAQSYLARSLSLLAVNEADRLGIRIVGFSGGVAYNELILSTIKSHVEKYGFRFLAHNEVPPGDGGISFGQAVVSSECLA